MTALAEIIKRTYRRLSLWHWFGRRLEADLKELAAKYAAGSLLDVGCGLKPYAGVFIGKVSHHIGVDQPPSFDSGTLARYRIDACADAMRLPYVDAVFDTVLCTQVLEHVEDPVAVTHELARVLRPGGHLILSTPLMAVVHEAPRDYYRFTPYAIQSLFRRTGLIEVEMRNQGGGWAMLGQSIAWRTAALVQGGSWLGGQVAVLLGTVAALPFFAMERLDRRAAFHEAINYLSVARKPLEDPLRCDDRFLGGRDAGRTATAHEGRRGG